MVETGGLENRFARKGNGGSNPSPSAKEDFIARCAQRDGGDCPFTIPLDEGGVIALGVDARANYSNAPELLRCNDRGA